MPAEDTAYAYVGDITKTERDATGNLMVFGKATGPDQDLDEQVADPEWLKEAMPDWAKWGNLREMHQPVVAGIGREMTSDDSGNWFIKSEVVDAGTARKIEAGALKGYSVGIKNARVVKDPEHPGGRIVGGTIVEVSYVDRPCNPTSTIGIAKMAGGALGPVESPAPGTSWLAKKATRTAQDGDNAVTTAPDMQKPGANDPACPLCGGSGMFRTSRKKKAPKVSKALDQDTRQDYDEKAAKPVQQQGAGGNGTDSGGKSIRNTPARDFAGPHGTFPIRTRDDVPDAASLAHHAANPAKVRARIRAIARRKFQMKDEDMPKSIRKTQKDASPDLARMVKKAVKSGTRDLRERAEVAEAKLAKIEKTVQPGGPRPAGFPQSPADEAKAVLRARLVKYRQLADSTSDTALARGYADLAKQVEGDLAKLA